MAGIIIPVAGGQATFCDRWAVCHAAAGRWNLLDSLVPDSSARRAAAATKPASRRCLSSLLPQRGPCADEESRLGRGNKWLGQRISIGRPYFTTRGGDFENSHSPYGTFDQGGNIWEWNESPIVAASSGGLRGGNWLSLAAAMLASHSLNDWHNDAVVEYNAVGFRVLEFPEPGSITLAAIICPLAYTWRRRKAT
jgi:hypothetical protein